MHITAGSASRHPAAAVLTIGSEGRGHLRIVVEDQNTQGEPQEDERTETAAVPGEPVKEIKSISKQPEKEDDVPERAPRKISSVVTLPTDSVEAENTAFFEN